MINEIFKFNLIVDNKPIRTEHQFLTGAQIKKLAGIPEDKDLYLVVVSFHDELIEDDKIVNFARPGWERFESRDRGNSTDIIVNGKRVRYIQEKITYAKVAEIAYGIYDPDKGYTMIYTGGPQQNPEGSMTAGSEVFVKHNMKFDVTQTYRS